MFFLLCELKSPSAGFKTEGLPKYRLSDALASLPAVTGVGLMTDKEEVTAIPALAERLGALEICKRQGTVVDNIGMAAHCA